MPSRNDNSTPWCFCVLAVSVIAAGTLASLLGTPALAEARTNRGTVGGIVLYVDDNAPAEGNGSTWQSAFRFLQDALDAARQPASGVTEIRVAQGVYKPDQGTTQTLGDDEATFLVPSGIALRGGYAGLGALDPDARDWDKFESVLSGDLLSNDPAPDVWPPPTPWTSMEDNSLHVATVLNGNAATIVDAVVVIAGRYSSTPENIGGGVYCQGGEPVISNCEFRYGMAFRGGGLAVKQTSALVKDCVFHHNMSMYAGGLHVDQGSPVIDGCIFTANRCSGGGGALGALTGAPLIRNCQFTQNVAWQGASGGAIGLGFSSPRIESCIFEANEGDTGGAIRGKPSLFDCVFIDNTANFGGAIYSGPGSSGDLQCTRCDFIHNDGHFEAGAVWGAGTFVDCSFVDNFVFWTVGGAVIGSGSFVNCRFLGNESWENGAGAIWINGTSALVNCLFSGNTTQGPGGAIRADSGTIVSMVNCTIANNTSLKGAGGIAASDSMVMSNCVVWGNNGSQIIGAPTVTYSCVQGGWRGVGNTSADPLFMNAVGVDGMLGTGDDDLRLSTGSPCIDAGDNMALPLDAFDLDEDENLTEPLPHDLDGGLRRVNDPMTPDTGNSGWPGLAIVDHGAYEFADVTPVVGDANGDGAVDVNDLVAVILHWGPCADSGDCLADVYPSDGGDGFVNVDDLISVIEHWDS